jgi:hypothetical protein
MDDEVFEDALEVLDVRVSNVSLSDENLIEFLSVEKIEVSIRDDDRFVVVGFSDNSTLVYVGESAGSAVLCVEVLAPEPDMLFTSGLDVIVGTRPGTAGLLGGGSFRNSVWVGGLRSKLALYSKF